MSQSSPSGSSSIDNNVDAAAGISGISGFGDQNQEYLLQFNNYARFLTSGVESSRNLENFVDVSLVSASTGKKSSIHKAHRVILSACSPYFEEVTSLTYAVVDFPGNRRLTLLLF